MSAAGLRISGPAAPEDSLADIQKEADVACLYHCDFGEPPRFIQMLNNIGNHYRRYGANPFDLQLGVVAHGGGVKFFLETVEGTTWRDEVMVPQDFSIASQSRPRTG